MSFVTSLNNVFDIRRSVPEDLRPLVYARQCSIETLREMRGCVE
jgi:hypothetical protein